MVVVVEEAAVVGLGGTPAFVRVVEKRGLVLVVVLLDSEEKASGRDGPDGSDVCLLGYDATEGLAAAARSGTDTPF